MAYDITPIMTANITDGYVASASSELVNELSSRLAWMAFDNVSNVDDEEKSRWHSMSSKEDPFPMWLQLKFPERHYVTKFYIKNAQPVHMGIKNFSLQGSNDGVNFDTLGSYTHIEDIGGEAFYNVTNPGFYQYYRINITSSFHSSGELYYCIIDEVKFYEPTLLWCKINNTIRMVDDAYVKVDGIWRKTIKFISK